MPEALNNNGVSNQNINNNYNNNSNQTNQITPNTNVINNNVNNPNANKITNNQNNPNNGIMDPKTQEQQKYSFSSFYTKATKTSLKNLGNTSYLNAVLQLLGSFRFMASYFLNPNNKEYITKNIGTMLLSFAMHRFFHHLYHYPEKENDKPEIYKPDSILYVLSNYNTVYNTRNRRNPNELINFILTTLHNELNKAKNNNNNQILPDVYLKNSVIQCGTKNFLNNFNSIISNHLNWFEIKSIQCNNCSSTKYDFNTFNTFELDIFITYNIIKKPITIRNCLDHYTNRKEQNFFCKNCRIHTQSIIINKIYVASNIIIFSLDRGNLEQKFIKIPFTIEEKIDINQYLENKDSSSKYQLTGMTSIEMKDKNQNYVSFCMSPTDKKWYKYKDENIESIQIDNVIKSHNNYDFIPCILVYKGFSN